MRGKVKQRKRGGFTLIELAIVVAILIVLLTGAILFLPKLLGKSKYASVKRDYDTIGKAIDNYRTDTNYYPQYIYELWRNAGNLAGWNGPYLKPPHGDTNANTYPSPLGGDVQVDLVCKPDDKLYLRWCGTSVSKEVAKKVLDLFHIPYSESENNQGWYDATNHCVDIVYTTKDYNGGFLSCK